LEFKTPSFLLTVQLSSGYYDVKGRLLSSIAVVKRFQTENIKSTRVTGSPFH